jgi:ATP-binding cassette subfamily F protein 3
MIQFDDVSLSFGGVPLFKNASFRLQKGERCGFVGRNGSGKSTLFKLITGKIESDSGSVILPKHYSIGHLEQHIHFTKQTVLEEALLALPEKERDQIYRAETILFGLGFQEKDMEAPISSFSGGYHLRLHLAKVLIGEPNCLLLDEPTNYLDILSIRWLTQFLSRWQGEFILISHDRDFMDAVSTHTMGIHREKVRKMEGTSIDFFEHILLEEEMHEKMRIKTDKKRAHMESFVERFGAKASKASQAESRKKMLDREPVLEKLSSLFALSFSFKEAPFPGQRMLLASNLEFGYTSPLIKNVSLEVHKKERIAIIGKNGRGKSTLLRLLAGDLEPNKGSCTLADSTKIGYFGQTNIDRLKKEHTIFEEIALAAPGLSHTAVKGIAGLMMFSGDTSNKKISVLSGGEKSRVLLGKIIAKPCNLLLLDEPTHHLDVESIEALIDALEDFQGALIIVTHSELMLRRMHLNKIVLCEEEGQKLFLGTYDEFLDKMGWEEEKTGKSKKAKPDSRKDKNSILRPLERSIEEYEKKIIALEESYKKNQKLIENGDTSAALLKQIAIEDDELMELNSKLYELYALYEDQKNC